MKEDSLKIHMASAKLMALSTDGASVMVGKTNGVAAKLRQSNDKLLNTHCVCHRLALACTDSCQELKFIKEVEDVQRQLWYYFQNSPKKTACFLKCQLELKKVSLSHSEKTKKLLAKRYKMAQFWCLCHCSLAELRSYPFVFARNWWCHSYWLDKQAQVSKISRGPLHS